MSRIPGLKLAVPVAMAVVGTAAQAFTFEMGEVKGSLDSTLQMGFARRTHNPSCSRVGDPSYCAGADLWGWGNGDNGNLNYRAGDFFSQYIKGNHELLLKIPDDWKFMARVSWLHDFSADETARTPLSSAAKDQIVNDVRLLDFWASKELAVGEQRARVRFGNQVLNWGESMFLQGGINATNAVDLQRLSQPGTQLKEAVLPAPMLSVAGGLGNGFNIEGYYQFAWNRSKIAPVGGYWSVFDFLDKGRTPIYVGPDPAAAAALGVAPGVAIPGVGDKKPGNGDGQFGLSLRWQPQGAPVNLGFYALNYHDKTPNLSTVNGGANYQWDFAKNRQLYGASVNFGLGDWAIGSELSYRPKDRVALSACYTATPGDNLNIAGDCRQSIDEQRVQWHLTGLLTMTPGDYGGILTALGGADSATFMGELAAISYPGLKRAYQRTNSAGQAVSQLLNAGYWSWYNADASQSASVGTKTSWGYNFDFSWTYDGSLIKGWQVTPEIYYFKAVKGETPNFMANFMEGANSANLILTFTQNPANWQFGLNYAAWWGGKTAFHNPYRDRDFFGAYVSRNF